MRKWLKFTGHLTKPSARSNAAIRLAFAMMELDGLPTDEDMVGSLAYTFGGGGGWRCFFGCLGPEAGAMGWRLAPVG